MNGRSTSAEEGLHYEWKDYISGGRSTSAEEGLQMRGRYAICDTYLSNIHWEKNLDSISAKLQTERTTASLDNHTANS
jgi:hypothetical protein